MYYFDSAATTKVDRDVGKLLGDLFANSFGNASSSHRLGEATKAEFAKAKEEIANCLGCGTGSIIFTSGATESNNTAVANIAGLAGPGKKRVIVSPIEHPSILEPLRHYEKLGAIDLDFLRVGQDCVVSVEELESKMGEDVAAVVVMAVNNETGAIQPVEEISKTCRQNGVAFHCDFVQGFGKIKFSPENYNFASFSAHKVYGPKGIGMLYVKNPEEFKPLMFGGGQQGGFRCGTEPVELIRALALTVTSLYRESEANNQYIKMLRGYMLDKLSDCPEVESNLPQGGVPHILNISVKGVRSDALALVFYQNDIMLSQGSACSSNHEEKSLSPVLLAMGLPEEKIRSSFRISFSKTNTIRDIEFVVDTIKNAVNKYKVSR
ncbi:MAG: cysteine desulfurase [Clostridiales bacterium]|nr:cysteine desulfurase [Clostridiales bacterium]